MVGERFKWITFTILTALITTLFLSSVVFAQEATPTPTPTPDPNATPTPTPKPDNSQKISDLQKKISEYESKISDLKGQEKSLNGQIGVMDSQIKLTELRIDATQEQIDALEKDIEIAKNKVSSLQENIDKSTKTLIGRIAAVYQVGKVAPWEVLLAANSIQDIFKKLTYLRIVQIYDKKKVYAAEQAKNDYNNQKNIFEVKQAEAEELNKKLEGYTADLDAQKKDKQRLLVETKGSEANYQKLLTEARIEYEAIQGVISGKGTEGEIGPVNQGDTIATIIQGSSCNSTGSHVHFTVSRNGATENPFNYLKSVDATNESGGDPFNPSGSWEWPISPPIQFNQGYGDTWYVRAYHSYPMHNGIDIGSSSSIVRAVKSGTLFQGSYTGKGGCKLKYVRIRHNDDGLDTFYLHVNYVN